MRVLILSRNAALYSTSRLVLAARSRGHEVTVADPLDFHIVISRGRPSMFLSGRQVPRADVVIPRIGASITNYGLAVVRQFDMMGVPVLNTARRHRPLARQAPGDAAAHQAATSTSPRPSARARPTRLTSRSASSAALRRS